MSTFNYHAYLASREWAVLREQIRKRSGGKCERCLVNAQDAVHHLTYERIGNERLDDLQAICDPCHQFLSGKIKNDPIIAEARRRLFMAHEHLNFFLMKMIAPTGKIEGTNIDISVDDALNALKATRTLHDSLVGK